MLQERYENKRLIVSNHVNALSQIPTITRESPTALRLLLDSVQKHLRALKALELPTEYLGCSTYPSFRL